MQREPRIVKHVSSARTFITFLAAILVAFVTHAENWNQYRGPNGDGKSQATNLPVEFSETENVRWKTPIHDMGWSSPVVWDNQIWVTAAREDGSELFAICVDLESGKIIHDIKVFDETNPQVEYGNLNNPCVAHSSHRRRPTLCPLRDLRHRLP
jgi:hypothetical protein